MVNENILRHFRNALRTSRTTPPEGRAVCALNVARAKDAEGVTAQTYYAPSIGTPNMGGMRWVTDWADHFRDMKYCDDIVLSIGHAGWYSDSYQDATYRGAIFQLRERVARWIKGE